MPYDKIFILCIHGVLYCTEEGVKLEGINEWAGMLTHIAGIVPRHPHGRLSLTVLINPERYKCQCVISIMKWNEFSSENTWQINRMIMSRPVLGERLIRVK